MATLKRTVLGVEIGAREVRMVEMRGGSPPQILRAGSVPLPAGAMDGERIVQIDAVADIVRGLHSRLGCQSRSAVVGMGIQSVVTRVLAIPRVPDSELRTVLEGELAHYQILRTGTGAFDYFRLDASSTAPDAMPSVLLMAVEDRIAQGYRLVIEKAGLQVLSLEPVALSLFRAAYPLLEAEPAALCLAITPQRSELAILDHAQIRLYRRLEMGSNDFLRGRLATAGFTGGPVNLAGAAGPALDIQPPPFRFDTKEEGDTDELDPADVDFEGERAGRSPLGGGSGGPDVLPQAAASLASDVQRSLDYYRREYPNATAISRVILATNDPDSEALSEWLSGALRMDVRVAEPPADPGLPRPIAAQLEAPQGLRYLGAVGLALQALTPEWRQVPRFNLSAGGQAAAIPIERDRLTAVMIMAVCVLIGGIFFGNNWNRHAREETENTERMKTTLGLKQQENETLAQRIQEENTLSWIVKSDNLPIPALLDLLTQRLPPGVGLTNLSIQRNGHITVEGNARDLQNFNLYYLELMGCPHFVSPHYQSLSTDPQTRITHFKVETSLRGTQDALSPHNGAL
jgi:type IV pilus assembly protein PilM